MPLSANRSLRHALAILVLVAATVLPAQQWTAPTPEELAMTSIPQVPGAPAIYLDIEEITSSYTSEYTYAARIKVLNDKGKEYANVELPPTSNLNFLKLAARTIHPDGKVVPFTGKPYEKLVSKSDGNSVTHKLFTFPDVQVGSILEFRYTLSNYFIAVPTWYLQSELFTRRQHLVFVPRYAGSYRLKNGENVEGKWVPIPILPPGIEVKFNNSTWSAHAFELNAADMMPLPTDQYMPPVLSLSYRVLFFATPYKSIPEFWAENGEYWSKAIDEFIGPKHGVSDFAKTLVPPTDTDDQKAKKIYAYIMSLENTDYTRERTEREDKQQGFKQIKSTDDLLKRGRGNSDQLTLLFVALARASGLKAYVMGIADRDEHIWLDAYLSFRQMDDYIAILNIAGKEVFYDPGQRYCEPGHLARVHALSRGLRQSDTGTVLASTVSAPYDSNKASKIADLKLDETANATGTVTATYTGVPALRWRHKALLGDMVSLKDQLRTEMQDSLPTGTQVEVLSIDNLTDYDQPVRVKFHIEGPIATSAGKRLLIPADIFESNEKPLFPNPKRETPIDFLYTSFDAHAVRYTLPQTLKVETAPEGQTYPLPATAVFTFRTAQTPNTITTYRNLACAKSYVLAKDYADLRAFYQKLEAKDQETIVLTHATAPK
jgi:transglutaminase-like putative cysteine protease